MADISQINLPDGTTYNLKDSYARTNYVLKAGDSMTGNLTAPKFIGALQGNADTATSATKATQDESGNNIKSTYANSISISDHTITLKNKNGTSLGTVTVPDNNTTYSFASGDANGQLKVTPSTGSAFNINIENRRFYGECTTDADVAAKTVTVSDFTTLQTGMTIHVYFKYYNTASSPTLNVNSSGAKAIIKRYSGEEDKPTWFGGQVLSFTYNGSKWIMNDAGDIIPAVESSDNSIAISTEVQIVVDLQWGDTTAEFVKKHNLTVNSVDWTKVANKPDVATEQEIASYTEASGSIASFSDGSPLPMRSLKAYIEPVQDLHGYDRPWVGGAGKNKLPLSNDYTDTKNDITITVKNGILYVNGTSNVSSTTDFYFSMFTLEAGTYILSATKSGTSTNLFLKIGNNYINEGQTFTLNEDSNCSAFLRCYEATYNNASAACMIRLASVTDATFAPYSNICPISGWDECNVTRTRKNYFKYNKVDNQNALSEKIPWQNGLKFKNFGSAISNGSLSIKYLDKLGTVIESSVKAYYISEGYEFAFSNPPSGTAYIQLASYRSTANGGIDEYISASFMVGTDISTYEPYNGSTYTIQFTDGSNPLIVYGGYVDIVSGLLTVYRGSKRFANTTGVSLFQQYDGTTYKHAIFTFSIDDMKAGSTWRLDDLMCNMAKVEVVGDSSENNSFTCRRRNNLKQLFLFTPTNMGEVTLSDLENIISTNAIEFSYELATPQTYQLTAQQVKSLLGVNNVWADTGDVELEYQPQNVIAELRDEIQQADSNVKQIPADYDNVDYELLLSSSNSTTEEVGSTHKSVSLQYNDSYTSFTHGNRKNNTGKGVCSFSTGAQNTVSGNYAQAEGNNCTATGIYSHAQGYASKATDRACQAEGWSTEASGDFGAHAEGDNTKATGTSSHAEGSATTASGTYSHAGGLGTKASGDAQCVIGKYNIDDTNNNYGFIIGNGTSSTSSNALTVNWNGNTWIAGSLTQGSSRKVKTNIAPIDISEIEKILELDGVKFDYIINGTDSQLERGFIAEDVAKILPVVVTPEQTNEDGTMIVPASINYIALIPYLVEICKKQQAEIDELKRNILEES